jgi:hypothetical protein
LDSVEILLFKLITYRIFTIINLTLFSQQGPRSSRFGATNGEAAQRQFFGGGGETPSFFNRRGGRGNYCLEKFSVVLFGQ